MGANKKIPMRQCVGCQEMKNKKEMIRVIRTSEGEFLLERPDAKMDGAHTFVQIRNV